MLNIGPFSFHSRLLLGTGKFPDFDVQQKAIDVSEAEVLTFAVRRMDIFDAKQPNLLEKLDVKKIYVITEYSRSKKMLKKLFVLQNYQKLQGFAT